jgi:hypothetical protein
VFGFLLFGSIDFLFILPACLMKHAGKIQIGRSGNSSYDSRWNEKNF